MLSLAIWMHGLTYHHGNLRKTLLERAAHVIAEQGIESLSLRALARDIGVSHSAPQRHFDDKAQLLSALATEGNRRLAEYVFAAADVAGDNAIERYAAMGKAHVRFSLEFPAYYKTIFHPDVLARADEELVAAEASRSAIVYDAAREAQIAGWLPDESLDSVVMFSVAAVRGLADLLVDPLHRLRDSAMDSEALIEVMIRLVIDPKNPQKSFPGK